MIDYKDPKAVMEVCENMPPFTGLHNGNYPVELFYAVSREALPYWVQEAERLRAELEILKEHHEGLKTAYKLKRRVCDEWQAKTELATNQELCEYVYRVKDIDRQIDDHLAGLEG